MVSYSNDHDFILVPSKYKYWRCGPANTISPLFSVQNKNCLSTITLKLNCMYLRPYLVRIKIRFSTTPPQE
jgi:hypothetical protein